MRVSTTDNNAKTIDSVIIQQLDILEKFLANNTEADIKESANYILNRAMLNIGKLKKTNDTEMTARFKEISNMMLRFMEIPPPPHTPPLVTATEKKDKIAEYILPHAKKHKEALKNFQFCIHVTEHCNLKCKGCGHFSNITKPKHVDIKIFERDFKRLSELTNKKCTAIDILGGEPLLNPEIKDLLVIARKYFDNTDIIIATNGLLIANQPQDFWECLKKNNIAFRITKYPVNINIEKIRKLCSEYNVKLKERDMGTWNKPSYDFTGSNNPFEAYEYCDTNGYCNILEDGKMAQCPLVFNSKHFNDYFNDKKYRFAEPSEYDYVDIFEAKTLGEILLRLRQPIPMCKYCTKKQGVKVVEWGKSNMQIDEWLWEKIGG